jgi:hypothetical protein
VLLAENAALRKLACDKLVRAPPRVHARAAACTPVANPPVPTNARVVLSRALSRATSHTGRGRVRRSAGRA